MTDPRKRAVQLGYDQIAEHYLAWGGQVDGDPRDRFLDEFARRLADGAKVLDLGCGAGIPSTKALAERFRVTGADFSQKQLRLARANIPSATLIHSDLADLDFPDESFHGITAFYSISHTPRDEHQALFHRVAGWLMPGGFFLASLGAGDLPDWTGEWLGVEMFFSSHDAATNRQLLANAGLSLVIDEVVPMTEPEGEVCFLWVLAEKA